jgi:FkbM family methyltransferase
MLKHLLQQLTLKLGYRISTIDTPPEHRNALRDLQYLLRDTHEPIVFDVGAYHGQFTDDLLRLIPNARVWALEPTAQQASLLNKKYLNRRIKVLTEAVSDFCGQGQLFENTDASTNSLLPVDNSVDQTDNWGNGRLQGTASQPINVRTLDAITRSESVLHIDLLKLDVQGAEPNVIRGASEILKRKAIHLIYTELIATPTYRNQLDVGEFISTFEQHNLRLFNVYNLMSASNGQLLQCDLIFKRD